MGDSVALWVGAMVLSAIGAGNLVFLTFIWLIARDRLDAVEWLAKLVTLHETEIIFESTGSY